jgi:hypothetical protein
MVLFDDVEMLAGTELGVEHLPLFLGQCFLQRQSDEQAAE